MLCPEMNRLCMRQFRCITAREEMIPAAYRPVMTHIVGFG